MGTKTAEIPKIVLQIHYEPLKTMEDVTKNAEKYLKTGTKTVETRYRKICHKNKSEA